MLSLIIRLCCIIYCIYIQQVFAKTSTNATDNTSHFNNKNSAINDNIISPTNTFYYDSKNAKLSPTFPQQSLTNEEKPKETLSENEKEEMTKGLKTGIEKRDTDHSKLFELLGKEILHFDNFMIELVVIHTIIYNIFYHQEFFFPLNHHEKFL